MDPASAAQFELQGLMNFRLKWIEPLLETLVWIDRVKVMGMKWRE